MNLTPRQQQTLELVAQGLTDPQIADHMRISVWTVKEHIAEIRLRLGVKSKHHAVAVGFQKGWLT